MEWHSVPASRWGLRPSGILLLLGGYTAAHKLMAFADYAGDPPLVVYLLALIAFFCFSTGSALLFCGHHLFDTVEISERWRSMRSLYPVVPALFRDFVTQPDGRIGSSDRPIADIVPLVPVTEKRRTSPSLRR